MPLEVLLASDHHVAGTSTLLESALSAPLFDAGASGFTECGHACMIILFFLTERAKTPCTGPE